MNRLFTACLIFYSVNAFTLTNEDKALYQSCASCHGPAATGNKTLASPQLAGQSYGYLKEQLINFRKGYRGNTKADTHGLLMMGSAQELTDESIDALAAYISALSPQLHRSTISGDAKKGGVFYAKNCGDCHGSRAQGSASIFTPNLVVLQDWYIRGQIAAYRSGWRGNTQSSTRAKHMRSMAGVFSEQHEVENVIAWLDVIKSQ